jgi:hypothetical protein
MDQGTLISLVAARPLCVNLLQPSSSRFTRCEKPDLLKANMREFRAQGSYAHFYQCAGGQKVPVNLSFGADDAQSGSWADASRLTGTFLISAHLFVRVAMRPLLINTSPLQWNRRAADANFQIHRAVGSNS